MILKIKSKDIIYDLIIDDEDYSLIKSYNWCINRGYAEAHTTGKNRTTIRMHRLIMNCPSGKEIDHKNHNKLDNRKENLRICDRNINCQNRFSFNNTSSIYKGVCLKDNQWMSLIHFNKTSYYIGLYRTEEMAALLVNKKYLELDPEFLALNILTKSEKDIILNENVKIQEANDKMHKTSKYKNVKKLKNNKWIGRYTSQGKEYTTKQYLTEEEAFNDVILKIKASKKEK